jgi:hypothetical protein
MHPRQSANSMPVTCYLPVSTVTSENEMSFPYAFSWSSAERGDHYVFALFFSYLFTLFFVRNLCERKYAEAPGLPT